MTRKVISKKSAHKLFEKNKVTYPNLGKMTKSGGKNALKPDLFDLVQICINNFN